MWRNHPSEPIQDFALNRLMFGTSCAPYIALRSVNQLAEDEKSNFPVVGDLLINDAYVDDVLSRGDDVPSAQQLQWDLFTVMKSGGFELNKRWSNANEVLEQIPEADRETKIPVEICIYRWHYQGIGHRLASSYRFVWFQKHAVFHQQTVSQ